MIAGVFKQAIERHHASEKKCSSLQNSRSLAEMSETWSEFLVQHVRFFNRLGHAMESGAERGWFERLDKTRRADPVMGYLLQARNADDHGSELITVPRSASVSITAGASGSAYIEKIEIRNGVLVTAKGWDGRPGNPLKPVFSPASVAPLPVTNYGTTFAPPAGFEKNVSKLAEAGVEYTRLTIGEAEYRFLKQQR